MDRPIVVAEIGLNHNGEVWVAKTLVSLCASLGVDYVKFQKRDVDKCYKHAYLDTRKITKWGNTVRDEKMGLEFGEEQYDSIAQHCEKEHIGWFASPYTAKDVEFLMGFNVPYMKVASQCIHNTELLASLKACGKPVIVSTGMCMPEDIGNAVTFFGPQLEYILHCVLTYPTDDKDVNLRAIKTLADRFPDKFVGFSSHSQKIIYPVAAAAMGAKMIEFHVTLDRNWDGPDHAASIGPTGLDRIMKHMESIREGLGTGKVVPHQGAISKASNYAWR